MWRVCRRFSVFEAVFMGSKFTKTAEVFPEFRMAESPKSVVVETDVVSVPPGSGSGSAYPAPEAGVNAVPEIPSTTTVEEQGLPVVPASKVTGDASPAPPLTPMTQEEDDDVIITQKTK